MPHVLGVCSVVALSLGIGPAPGGVVGAPLGRPLFETQVIDENGNARESYSDMVDRVLAATEHPASGQTSVNLYGYSPLSELTSITDAEGNASALSYDRRGLLVAMDNPDTGLIEMGYDLMGNAVSQVEPNHRANGTSVRRVYERDRLAAIDYPAKPDVTFTYGLPGAADGRAGRIARIDDETGSVERFYGALGEVRREVRTIEPFTGKPSVFVSSSTFDSFGRILEMVYPDGERLEHRYDGGGALVSVTGFGDGWSRPYVSGLQYDVFGNRTRATFANGVTSSWSYSAERVRLASATTKLPAGPKVQDLRYAYDLGGNPTGITSHLPEPGPSEKLPGSGEWSFSYDGVDRLVRAQGQTTLAPGKATLYDQRFAYSPSHNLLTKVRAHSVLQPSSLPTTPPHTNIDYDYLYESGRPHAPSRVGDLLIEYDPSGNAKSRTRFGTGQTQHLTWDDDGRLIQVQSAGTLQRNRYDASGLRVVRKGRHGQTLWASQFFELQNQTRATKHIFAGSVRVASVLSSFGTSGPGKGHTDDKTPPGQSNPNEGPSAQGPPSPPPTAGVPYYFHQGHLGSTSVLTDAEGAVHEHLQYFPDGELWVERGPRKPVNGYRFSGKPLDPETGFYDFGQRFYDPKTSLWLGIDPAFTDDPSAAIGRPMMTAPFAYGNHGPLRFVDPDGRLPIGATEEGDIPVWRGVLTAAAAQAARRAAARDTARVARNVPKGFGKAAVGLVDAALHPKRTAREIAAAARAIASDPVGSAKAIGAHLAEVASDPDKLGQAIGGGGFNLLTGSALVKGLQKIDIVNQLRRAGGLGDAVDAAFDSGRVTSGTMVRGDARSLAGSGPKRGQGAIWYHDNVKIRGAGPNGSTVNLRTHSPNPNAPPGSYSQSNYTTQINTNNGRYLLPDGSWKRINEMSPAERAAAHYPGGN